MQNLCKHCGFYSPQSIFSKNYPSDVFFEYKLLTGSQLFALCNYSAVSSSMHVMLLDKELLACEVHVNTRPAVVQQWPALTHERAGYCRTAAGCDSTFSFGYFFMRALITTVFSLAVLSFRSKMNEASPIYHQSFSMICKWSWSVHFHWTWLLISVMRVIY